MRYVLASLVRAVGVVCACSAVAGEKPEQIVHGGKPITLGAAVEATEWLTIRDVKLRLGTFTVDGKPALVASGMLDSHWELKTVARVTISAYFLRDDVRPRTLVPFAVLQGDVEVTEPGAPTKFYVAGDVRPPSSGVKQPKSPGVLYYTAAVSPHPNSRVGEGPSTRPGEKPGEFIHANLPIALGAWVEAKERETIAVRDLAFQMGQLLDGKPAVVLTGQVESPSPAKQGASVLVQVYVRREQGDPDMPVLQYATLRGSVEGLATGKPTKFQAVGFPRDTGMDVPVPKRFYYCMSW